MKQNKQVEELERQQDKDRLFFVVIIVLICIGIIIFVINIDVKFDKLEPEEPQPKCDEHYSYCNVNYNLCERSDGEWINYDEIQKENKTICYDVFIDETPKSTLAFKSDNENILINKEYYEEVPCPQPYEDVYVLNICYKLKNAK